GFEPHRDDRHAHAHEAAGRVRSDRDTDVGRSPTNVGRALHAREVIGMPRPELDAAEAGLAHREQHLAQPESPEAVGLTPDLDHDDGLSVRTCGWSAAAIRAAAKAWPRAFQCSSRRKYRPASRCARNAATRSTTVAPSSAATP